MLDKNLRTLRKRKGLTQETLAKAAALIGVSPRTYSHMKNDLHTDDWKPRQYKTLLRRLGVPIDELRVATTYTSL